MEMFMKECGKKTANKEKENTLLKMETNL